LIASEHETGSEVEFANDLSRHDEPAAQGAQRMQRIAKLAIMAFIRELQNPFEGDCAGGCIHIASMQRFIRNPGLVSRPGTIVVWASRLTPVIS
jgi:hypothetical protein